MREGLKQNFYDGKYNTGKLFKSRRRIRDCLEIGSGMEEIEIFSKRLDVINQGLFDNFYYSSKIKLKFMRL